MATKGTAISRKMASGKQEHADMVDHAINELHSSDLPPHVGIPAMHALLIAKHFTLNGLKVPDHLQNPPNTGAPAAASEDSSKKSSDDEDSDGD